MQFSLKFHHRRVCASTFTSTVN